MTKHSLLWLLNLLLLGGCLRVSFTIYRDYRAFHQANQIKWIEGKAGKKLEMSGIQQLAPTPRKFDSQEFKDVVERNLFLESRSLQSLVGPQAAETVPPLEPKPLLLGVAMVGSETQAFVQGVQVQPGQKRTRLLRVGDDFQGYRVTQISASRLELSFTSNAGNVTTHVLNLTDQRNRQLRGPVAQNPVAPASQVISVGGSRELAPAASTSAQMAARAAVSAAGPYMQSSEFIDPQGRRVVGTPFGDMIASQPPVSVNQMLGMGAAGGGAARPPVNSTQQPQTLAPRAAISRFPYP